MFPQSYVLSLTDIIYITSKRSLWELDATTALTELVKNKQTKKKTGKMNLFNRYNGYIVFDHHRQESP